MAFLACAYGILKVGSIWYPINLLAAVAYRESERLPPRSTLFIFTPTLSRFAFLLHGLVSPFLSLALRCNASDVSRGRAILLGGLVAPALWSGLIYTIPRPAESLLASHIDWFLVLSFRNSLWNCCWQRLSWPGEHPDAGERGVCSSRRN